MTRKVLVVSDDSTLTEAIADILRKEKRNEVVVISSEIETARVTWKPVVGQVWRPLPESKTTHGPGAKFEPDGQGGGKLSFMVMETRRGFRPGPRMKTIRKQALGAPAIKCTPE